MNRYLIISPVKNEQDYIHETIQSVKNQTIQPEKWVIVNDCSQDYTQILVEKAMVDYDRIMLVNREDGNIDRKRGKRIVEAFYDGYNRVKVTPHDFIVKLDGDLRLPANYFERNFAEFAGDPQLGISSGVSLVKENGQWIPEHSCEGHTFGACKVYRRTCFQAIGGLFPGMGWDGIDQMKALMLGWNARSIPDLLFHHLRPMGRASGKVKAAFEEGIGCYIMGYHPVYFMARVCSRMRHYTIWGGAAMIYGFLKGKVEKIDRIEDPKLVRFIRTGQMQRLKSGGRKKTGHW